MPNPLLSVDDFANAIKAKYPDYQNHDNQELTARFLSKNPFYIGKVDTTQLKNFQPSLSSPKPPQVGNEELRIPTPSAIPGLDLLRSIPALQPYLGKNYDTIQGRQGPLIQPSDVFRGTIGNKVTPGLTAAGGIGGGLIGSGVASMATG